MDGRPLEVWIAAYGPKALALTGRSADGFILQLADPYIAEWMIKAVRGGREEAGRDPAAMKFCVAAPGVRRRRPGRTSRDQCAGSAAWSATTSPTWSPATASTRPVPEALTAYIKGRRVTTTPTTAGPGNPDTDFVPDEIVDRFCLLGPAEAHMEKLTALRELGVDQFAVYDMHDAKEAVIDAYGEHIIPAMG